MVDADVFLAEECVLQGVGVGVVDASTGLELVERVSGVGISAEERCEEFPGIQCGGVMRCWRVIRFPFIPETGFLRWYAFTRAGACT